jgi:putative transposase
VQLVISDAHRGLTNAIGQILPGAAWQRCRVHFMRNLLARVPRRHSGMVAAIVRTIFAQPSPDQVRTQLDAVALQLADAFPAAAELLLDAKPELTAFASFPQAHWTKIWSNNPIERLNREIKRRTDVVGIFPNPAAVDRLVGAILIEAHDEWQASERRYLSEASMAKLTRPQHAALNGYTPALNAA